MCADHVVYLDLTSASTIAFFSLQLVCLLLHSFSYSIFNLGGSGLTVFRGFHY